MSFRLDHPSPVAAEAMLGSALPLAPVDAAVSVLIQLRPLCLRSSGADRAGCCDCAKHTVSLDTAAQRASHVRVHLPMSLRLATAERQGCLAARRLLRTLQGPQSTLPRTHTSLHLSLVRGQEAARTRTCTTDLTLQQRSLCGVACSQCPPAHRHRVCRCRSDSQRKQWPHQQRVLTSTAQPAAAATRASEAAREVSGLHYQLSWWYQSQVVCMRGLAHTWTESEAAERVL